MARRLTSHHFGSLVEKWILGRWRLLSASVLFISALPASRGCGCGGAAAAEYDQ